MNAAAGNSTLAARLRLRASRRRDHAAIAILHRAAFGREFEAKLALALMTDKRPAISLVGECDRRIVGHVLLSEIGAPVRALALAPLAVAASHREMQVGSRLVARSIEVSREAGYDTIFVLGDTGFYERFGFSTSAAEPFEAAWRGPHFMVLELKPGALAGKTGRLIYPAAFEALP